MSIDGLYSLKKDDVSAMKRPVHFEILADDPEKAADFYRQVFEWEISTWGGEQAYWLVTTGPDDEPGINGAIMHRHFDQAVVNTQEVESLADALERIDGAGGKVVQGPNEIPGVRHPCLLRRSRRESVWGVRACSRRSGLMLGVGAVAAYMPFEPSLPGIGAPYS